MTKPNREKEAFLDIETTGLSPDCCDITVVGIYLVEGEDSSVVQLVGMDACADRISEVMCGVSSMYTYNGSRFDIPFIHRRLGINLDCEVPVHCDLMRTCWQHNLYGGLKSVEKQLGIARELSGINGLDAVRLWWQYVNNYDKKALETLLIYNREDVVNLKILRDKLATFGNR